MPVKLCSNRSTHFVVSACSKAPNSRFHGSLPTRLRNVFISPAMRLHFPTNSSLPIVAESKKQVGIGGFPISKRRILDGLKNTA